MAEKKGIAYPIYKQHKAKTDDENGHTLAPRLVGPLGADCTQAIDNATDVKKRGSRG